MQFQFQLKVLQLTLVLLIADNLCIKMHDHASFSEIDLNNAV